jgi:hypothetical protein
MTHEWPCVVSVQLAPDLADALFNWGAFLLDDATTPFARAETIGS